MLINPTKIYFWNSSYASVMKQQASWIEKIQNDQKQSAIMIGSHPHCFTMGRGMQKRTGGGGEVLSELVPFESKDIEARYPGWEFHQVARAGGMTFHHLGQLVIYPLFNLNELKISLPKIMFLLFDAVKDTLLSFAPLLRMEVKKEPLGLWIEGKKVASIGMALDRFVTCHGLALNLEFDSKVKSMLRQEYPCGIPGGQYGACEEWEQLKVLPKEEMAELILLRFLNAIRSQI